MKKEDLIEQLQKKFPSDSREMIRAVATDVYYSGEAAEEIIAKPALLDRLRSKYEEKAEGRAQVKAHDPLSCPICRLPMKPVKLDNDRKAVFCSKHFVVYPAREQ